VRILSKILSNIAMRIPGAKSQFLPSLEDLKDQVCRELAERLEGKSVRETLTNILEWQERNIRYWKERCYIDLLSSPISLLISILMYLVIFLIVSIPILAMFYILLERIIGFHLTMIIFFATIGLFLYAILKASTPVKLICILVFSYPLYQVLRIILVNIPKPGIVTSILDITVFNWIIFGISLFVLAYLFLIYYQYTTDERTFIAKVKKLWDLVMHTFSLSLPVFKIISYRLAVCRDYAKLTATLLYNLFPDSKIFFFTSLRHVATGIEIDGKIYVLDQRLPVLTLGGWLQKRKRSNINSHILLVKDKGVDIEKFDIPLSQPRTHCRLKDIEKSILETLNVRQYSEKRVHKMEIPLKNYALYCEDDDIVKYSIVRSIKNILEREFCASINKITNIRIRDKGDGKDWILEVYYSG